MNRIKELRQENKLSQIELANKVHASNQAISAYESGTREPKEPTWQALADFFNVSVAYLKGAYNKEEIAKIIQQEYKHQYDLKNKSFPFVVSGLSSATVDDYFISIGVIPYDIKQELFLLNEQQVNDLQFWINNLEPIYNTTVVKWLLEKPTLSASKSDVLEAVSSAMDGIINKSSTIFVNPWLSKNHDSISDEQYFAKRLKFINDHIFYDEETLIDNGQKHVEMVPYIDWDKVNNN